MGALEVFCDIVKRKEDGVGYGVYVFLGVSKFLGNGGVANHNVRAAVC